MKTLFLLVVAALSAPAARADEAQDNWEARCQKCHGPDGRGKTQMGKKVHMPDFTKARWQKRHDDGEILKMINDGVEEKGKRLMPAFKEKLTADQIDALVAYVRAFGKPGGAAKEMHDAPAAEAPAPDAEQPKE